jgi:hypothetical protein
MALLRLCMMIVLLLWPTPGQMPLSGGGKVSSRTTTVQPLNFRKSRRQRWDLHLEGHRMFLHFLGWEPRFIMWFFLRKSRRQRRLLSLRKSSNHNSCLFIGNLVCALCTYDLCYFTFLQIRAEVFLFLKVGYATLLYYCLTHSGFSVLCYLLNFWMCPSFHVW